MKTATLVLLLAVQDAPKHRLVFEPKKDGALRVVFVEDNTWEYKDDDMKGTMRTELTLAWRFEAAGEKLAGTATFERVLYRGKGVKKGEAFDHDLEWTSKDGYLRGQDSDADKRWGAGEIKEGVPMTLDRRAECDEGAC